MIKPDLGALLQYFFTQHLGMHKQVSPRTITAYRDTFRLLLNYLNAKLGKAPSALQIADLDSATLNWPTVMVRNGPPC